MLSMERRRRGGRLRSGRRGPGLDPGEPADVVDDVGQADFGFGAGEADGTDDQAEAAFLFGKDVLDLGPHLRPPRVAAADVRRHRPAARFGALKPRHQAAPVEQVEVGLGAIGGVRPHPARQVVAIEEAFELTAVVGGGVGDGGPADEPVGAVDANVVLVAERRYDDLRRLPRQPAVIGPGTLPAALQGPAAVAVDLPGARRFPVLRHAAAL